MPSVSRGAPVTPTHRLDTTRWRSLSYRFYYLCYFYSTICMRRLPENDRQLPTVFMWGPQFNPQPSLHERTEELTWLSVPYLQLTLEETAYLVPENDGRYRVSAWLLWERPPPSECLPYLRSLLENDDQYIVRGWIPLKQQPLETLLEDFPFISYC